MKKCSCLISMLGDRSLKQLQSLVTGGILGKRAGMLKPFHNPKKGELAL